MRLMVIAIALGLASPLAAQTPQQRPAPAATPAAQQYAAAARDMASRIDNRPATGAMPRTTDGQVAALIAILSDRGNRFGTAAFPVQGVASYQRVCSVPVVLTQQYARFGLDRRLAANADPARRDAIVAQVASANTRAYQNQVLPLLGFAIRCNALHVPALEQVMTQPGLPPARRQALGGVRAALAQQIATGLTTLAQPGIQPQHRAALLGRIAANAPALVRTMTLAQRDALGVRVARYLAASPPALRSDFARLQGALGDRTCVALCRLP